MAPGSDSPPVLDVAFARSQFPGLQDDWVLFDNAGGSVTPTSVIQRVTEHMSRYGVQLGASYPRSVEASRRVEQGHAAMAELVGADPDEVIIGSSTTANLALLARALVPTWQRGDEIIVTDLDHAANIGGWRRLEREGIVVKRWPFCRETCRLDPQTLTGLLSDRTRLVAFTHCANVVGAIEDVKSLTGLIHDAGALACVDGVAYAPHRLVDVRAWDVDFYAFSTYKVYGPHLGVLYGKREHLLRAEGQNHWFVTEDALPSKLEPGNVNHELTSSLPGVLEYMDTLVERHFGASAPTARRDRLRTVFDLFARHEQALAERLLAFLRDRSNVRVFGPTDADAKVRVPTITFAVAGRRSSQIVTALDEHKLAARYGHFYAPEAIDAMGVGEQDGVVRVSMVHYNTLEEVDRLVDALDQLI